MHDLLLTPHIVADDVWAVSNSDQAGASIIHYNGWLWTRIDRTQHMPLVKSR